MSASPFVLSLKNTLPTAEWPWALAALRQDAQLWNSLAHSELGEQALATLPAVAQSWTPAALALLALKIPLVPGDLQAAPLQALPAEWQARLMAVLGDALDTGAPVAEPTGSLAGDLAAAALHALALRERYRQKNSWRAVLSAGGLERTTARTALACLVGLLPEDQRLLRALAQMGDGHPRPDLALHALLCQPLPPEALTQRLNELLGELPPAYGLALLKELATQRPRLAQRLAQRFLADHAAVWAAPAAEGVDLGEQFYRLAGSLRLAQAYQLAADADRAVPLLAEALREVRRLRGHLSAHLAQALTNAHGSADDHWRETAHETSLEAWKQSLQLAPDIPAYGAGLVRALLEAGRLADARAYLEQRQAECEQHADLALASAVVASRLDLAQEAGRRAQLALRLAQAGQLLTVDEYLTLARLLTMAGQELESAQASRLGLAAYPLNGDLLALSAQAALVLDQPEQALADASAALAAADLNEAIPEQTHVQDLMVQALQAVGDWTAALEVLSQCLAAQCNSAGEPPALADWHALLRCAAQAGRPEQVIQAARQALELAPDDLLAHRSLAEASLALGDPATAAGHFADAARLAPDQAELWLALVRAHRQAGQEAQAVEALRLASQAIPNEAEFHLSLGEVYFAQGSLTQALVSFHRAASLVESRPLTGRAALGLGSTLLQLGHLVEARQVLEPAWQALQAAQSGIASPGATALAIDLAYAYARTLLGLGELEPAVPLLSEVVRQRPQDVSAALDLARALLHLPGQPAGAQRAIPFLQNLLGAGPEGGANRLDERPALRAEGRALLAEAYAAVGEWQQAMDAYRRALDEPLNRDAASQGRLSTGLGVVALKLNQPEMAVAALQEAARTQPLNPALQRTLSEAYLANNLALDAFQTAQAVVDLNPDDLDGLTWFINQAMRVLDCLGGSDSSAPADRSPAAIQQAGVRSQIARALDQATQLAPQRADLLLYLGRLRLENGDRQAALEAYRRLSTAQALAQVTPADLQHTAHQASQLGDAHLAVTLLRSALDQSSMPGTPEACTERANLYADLAQAYDLAGDQPAALQAVDQALGLVDEAQLHAHKAGLLQALGRGEAALDSLHEAVRRAPRNPQLRYKMAEALQRKGDVAPALEQAEQGLEQVDGKAEPALDRSLHLLAAELAHASLRPRRAMLHLQAVLPEEVLAGRVPPGQAGAAFFDPVARLAEVALDLEDESLAALAVDNMLRVDSEHPRSQAAAGRLAGRRGNPREREHCCHVATRYLIGQQQPITPPHTRQAYVAACLAVAQADLEAQLWDDALEVLQRLIEVAPETPLGYFKLAQVLTERAEVQSLCQDLDVVQHAPSSAALAEDARQQMERNYSQAQVMLAVAGELEAAPDTQAWEDECSQTLGMWLARGRAVFQPNARTAAVLAGLLRVCPGGAPGLAALIAAYRHCDQRDAAVQAFQRGRQSGAQATNQLAPVAANTAAGPGAHALVLTQLALARPDARQAVSDAGEALDAAGDDWPPVAMLYYLVARLSQQAGVLDAALQALSQALSGWPDEPRWHELAARIYQAQQAALGLPDPVKALLHLEQAVALDPQRAETHLQIGRIYLEGGQASHAIQSLEQASRLDAGLPDVWMALAQAHTATGAWEQAAACADKAAAHSNDPSQALLLRGQIALQTSNPRGALSRAQAALRANPNQAEALYLLSRALEALGRPAEALKALEKALPNSANGLSMQVERIHLLRRSRGLEAAIPALQELLEANPGRPDLLALLATWQAEAGQSEAAVQTARQALQEGAGALPAEQRASLHNLIGLAMRRSGQLDQAIQHLSEAALAAPANLDILLELGRAYQERREYKQALKTYQKAMGVAGGDYRPYYQAGLVLKDSKDYVAAEAMLRRAAQMAPNEVSVHRLLGAVVTLNLVHNRKLAASD